MNHWGFDGRVHRGELVVHEDAVRPVLAVFGAAFDDRFPIRRMRAMSHYDGDDRRAMADDNTSAFNCRRVTGDEDHLSRHSYGDAVDINPLENPYVDRSGTVHPPGSRAALDREPPAEGMLVAGDAVTRAIEAAGWEWGGAWSPPTTSTSRRTAPEPRGPRRRLPSIRTLCDRAPGPVRTDNGIRVGGTGRPGHRDDQWW
ncbi:M15 family metallopeptidase [Streptomyces zhihengii]